MKANALLTFDGRDKAYKTTKASSAKAHQFNSLLHLLYVLPTFYAAGKNGVKMGDDMDYHAVA